MNEGEEGATRERISPLPTCGAKEASVLRWERGYARYLLCLSVLLAVATFALQVYITVDPPASDDDQADDDAQNATAALAGMPRMAQVFARAFAVLKR